MSSTKLFRVSYSVTSYYTVDVERPADICEADLISGITKNELLTGEATGEYDGLKSAWREGDVSLILDTEGDEVIFS